MPDPAASFERLPALIDADPVLVRQGRFLSAEFLVGIGGVPFHVRVAEGRIAALARGPKLLRSTSFRICADAEAWREHWQPFPKPGFHDLFALAKAGRATIAGDLQPLMANLQYVKDVLAAPRRLAAG